MEKAREAFAADATLHDVRVVELSSIPYVLQVKAPPQHDWTKTAASAAERSWWFRHYRADDLSANVATVLSTELAVASPERQGAWRVLAEQNPRATAERLVLQHFELMVASRNEVWDPRLEVLAETVAVFGRLWKGLAPELAQPLPADAKTLAERVRGALATADISPISQELAKAQQLLGDRTDLDLAMRFYLLRVREAVAAVEPHASRIAQSTTATARREAYERLAQHCAEVVAAIDLLCRK
jgi:hypothetical protein